MGLKKGERQMSMIISELDELVSANHKYRAILNLFDWTELTKPLLKSYSKSGRKGYAVVKGFKCLFLQFLEDRAIEARPRSISRL